MGMPIEETAFPLMEMPSLWTVSGFPEIKGCHQAKSLPSNIKRYAHDFGSH